MLDDISVPRERHAFKRIEGKLSEDKTQNEEPPARY